MAVTLKDVALRAGVSRSAVSRTFTKGASVSQKTRDKVLAAAVALNYQPNILARSLSTRRTKLVGLVSNNFHNPVFLQVFDLFTRRLQDHGLRPLLVNLSDETDPEASIQLLRQYSVDGVIVASSTLPPEFSKLFAEAGLPVVHTFGRYAEHPDVDTVGIDNFACGRMAAAALLSQQYTRIGYLGGPASATSSRDRLAGFQAELDKRSDVQLSHRFAEAYSFDAGRTAMLQELSTDPAEAYFCADDVLTIGAMSAVRSSGRSVPEDIGLIGLNDMEMAGWDSFSLTTIHQPIDAIVTASVDLVVAKLGREGPQDAPKAHLFPCHVVYRGTLR
ncbi:MAG: LacI family DNA-binding transcriptional regulator [Pseudomonadota bacterium]